MYFDLKYFDIIWYRYAYEYVYDMYLNMYTYEYILNIYEYIWIYMKYIYVYIIYMNMYMICNWYRYIDIIYFYLILYIIFIINYPKYTMTWGEHAKLQQPEIQPRRSYLILPIRDVKSSGAELPAAINVAPATSSLRCRFCKPVKHRWCQTGCYILVMTTSRYMEPILDNS